MNSIWIVLVAIAWIISGYIFYAKKLEKKLSPNDRRKTPASSRKKDIDFSPSKKPFLIGHHFASIAGAGPIIGPILAINYFGWLPTFLWILVGVVFFGAVHDYATLMVSVRNKAKGISNIAKDYLGSKSGWIFGLMIWLTLVLIITVFSASAADSFVEKPDLVIPILAITIISPILGVLVRKPKVNYKYASIVAILLIFFFAWLGFKFPISLPIDNPSLLRSAWITIILSYATIASVVPIWFLLRPRDYLSAIQMLLILTLGVIGVIVVRPVISAPAYISNSPFPIWPILFITVACGAISGFHGIVSSGTTSKQLSKESHGKAVGYGGMLLEGALAVLVSIVVIAGVKWGAEAGGFQLTLEKGWIVLFSTGFGNIVGSMGVPLITVGFASLLGAFMVNQSILTSVDTSTRLGRFVISENLFPKLNNKFLTTVVTIIPAWLLAITNSYETIWRLFGSSNQLIASISMIAVCAYLVSKHKSIKIILIPALFILITTLSALLYLTFRQGGYLLTGEYSLAVFSIAMFCLGAVVSFEGFLKIHKKIK